MVLGWAEDTLAPEMSPVCCPVVSLFPSRSSVLSAIRFHATLLAL